MRIIETHNDGTQQVSIAEDCTIIGVTINYALVVSGDDGKRIVCRKERILPENSTRSIEIIA